MGTNHGEQDHLPTAAERAAIYRELHRDYLDRQNTTRQIEWIVNGALWAGVVLAGGQAAGHVDLQGWSFGTIIRVGLYGGALHFALWMYPIQSSENTDAELAQTYQRLTHLALFDKDSSAAGGAAQQQGIPLRSDKSQYKRFCNWFPGGRLRGLDWPIVECLTTAVLIWAVLYFLKSVPWALRA